MTLVMFGIATSGVVFSTLVDAAGGDLRSRLSKVVVLTSTSSLHDCPISSTTGRGIVERNMLKRIQRVVEVLL
jgi:hypothetical protein